MVIEEIKFINDVMQDARIDARIETKYDILINCIFSNARLNWNKDDLTLKSDEKLFNLIEALEPDSYKAALKDLQEKDEKTE